MSDERPRRASLEDFSCPRVLQRTLKALSKVLACFRGQPGRSVLAAQRQEVTFVEFAARDGAAEALDLWGRHVQIEVTRHSLRGYAGAVRYYG